MRLTNDLRSVLVIFISTLFLFPMGGCVSTKTSETPKVELEEGRYIGVVTSEYAKDGCAWLIRFHEGEEEKLLIPVQFPEEFKKDGQQIEFSYHLSRISQGECQQGQPAVLEEPKLR